MYKRSSSSADACSSCSCCSSIAPLLASRAWQHQKAVMATAAARKLVKLRCLLLLRELQKSSVPCPWAPNPHRPPGSAAACCKSNSPNSGRSKLPLGLLQSACAGVHCWQPRSCFSLTGLLWCLLTRPATPLWQLCTALLRQSACSSMSGKLLGLNTGAAQVLGG